MGERDPLNIVGQVLADKYRIEKLVGEGGFAVVYRATQVIWNKPVAIKLFNGLSSAPPDQRDELAAAFVQEGALLTELSTQTVNIVQARDVGTFTTPDGRWVPFMVLEWLEGKPLDEVLLQERHAGKPAWPLDEVLSLLGQAAAALEVAHKKGIAHRDIKPANLFIVPHDESDRVKVLDFGVAKMMSDNTHIKAALAKTGQNITSFTPQYGAPEQFNRNYGATGPWTDVYALALVGSEMLAGKEALQGDDVVQLAVCSGNPQERPTPQALGAQVPDAIEAVFAKALAVSTAQRYASAGEFWQALQNAAGGAVPMSLHHPVSRRAEFALAQTELLPTGPGSGATTQPQVQSTVGAPASRRSLPLAGAVLGALVLGAGAYWVMHAGGTSDVQARPQASSAALAALPAPAPSASAVVVEQTCPDDMAKIAAGQFFMGSDAETARDNEKPAHNVKLDAYCIDLYEVTAAKYKACSDVGKCKRARPEVTWPGITKADEAAYATACTIDDAERREHPINCVSWDMANTFCQAYDKRLPTEAEWEYATRGPDGRIYPWGDEPPTAEHLNACGTECLAWAKQHGVASQFAGGLYDADDGFPTTAPVGKFPAGRSRFGPFDVVGNVWEWVADWEGAYDAKMKQNPTGPADGKKRVIRGGAWNGSFPSWLRPSFRYAQDPAAKSPGIGFRCATSVKPPP